MFNKEVHSRSDQEVAITFYADERKKLCDRWDYMGIVVIPTQEISQILSKLTDIRRGFDYFHELKFSRLPKRGKGAKVNVAAGWIKLVLQEAQEEGNLFFSILGIDRKNLDFSAFGEGASSSGKYATVYNRFFRTQLVGTLKYCFSQFDRVLVSEVVHDNEGNLQTHEYFDWHSLTRAEREVENVSFAKSSISFVTSDPTAKEAHPKHTELIQFTDILLGAVSHCIECHNPDNKGQHIVASELLPLVDRLCNNPKNKNSSYCYHRRYSLQFFPKAPTVTNSTILNPNSIYTERTLALSHRLSGQKRLFEE